MNLKSYYGKRVRIYEKTGECFEGICDYCGKEYCEHEFGQEEECLQIANFLFFKNNFQNIEVIESYQAPFGCLEELNFRDGVDSIADELFCEEEEHVLRMLKCLTYYLTSDHDSRHIDKKALAEVLRELQAADISDICQEEITVILKRLG